MRAGDSHDVLELLGRITAAFTDRGVPSPTSLVVFDGFDQLDKESAVEAFAGKSREQVTAFVGRGPSGWQGLWGVEELASIEPAALQYYVEPFLRYLLNEEYQSPQDVSYWFSYHLSEVVERRGPELFDSHQREVIVELATLFHRRLVHAEDWQDEDWLTAHRRSYAALIERLRP